MNGKSRISFLLFFLAFISTGLWAQPATFKIIHGEVKNDRPFDIESTPDGGFLIVGGSGNFGGNNSQGMLFKTDSAGQKSWAKGIGGTEVEEFYSVDLTIDSGHISGGITNSFGSGGYDGFVLKTNSNGDSLWSKTIGGSDWEELKEIRSLDDSSFVMTGNTYSWGNGGSDIFLHKMGPTGDSLWTRTFGGQGDEMAESVYPTSNNGFLICGKKEVPQNDTTKAYFIMTDSIGTLIWDTTFSYGVNNNATSVTQKTNGEFVTTINWSEKPDTTKNFIVISFNNQGTIVWERFGQFAFPADEEGFEIIESIDGNLLLGCYTTKAGGGKKDGHLVKLDPSGWFQWGKTFGDTENEFTYCITQAQDSGLVSAGFTTSYGNSPSNIYLIKAGLDGSVTPDSNIQMLTDMDEPELASFDRNGLSLYPNPAQTKVHITFPVNGEDHSSSLSIQLTDLAGRVIKEKEVESDKLSPGLHSTKMKTAAIERGFYLIRVRTETREYSGKVMIRE